MLRLTYANLNIKWFICENTYYKKTILFIHAKLHISDYNVNYIPNINI